MPLIDINASGKGIAFGKTSEKDRMEIALDIELTGKLIQEQKQTPELLNGWVNFSPDYEPATYWKDKNEIVHLSGVIKNGTTENGTTLFLLPADYRPDKNEMFSTISFNSLCRIDVSSGGLVSVEYGANENWLSLCGIEFKAKG